VRDVVLGDAFEFCESHEGAGAVITSPPDAAEVDMAPEAWEPWFRRAIDCCLVLAGDHPAVFYVTDRRHEGRLYSKGAMVIEESMKYASVGQRVLWHKIALRRQVGAIDIHRPTYSHLIAVGGPLCRPGSATPDVFERGRTLYPNGMGFHAAYRALQYLETQGHGTVYNPFCGMGTVLALADVMGMDSVGIDNDPLMVGASRLSTVDLALAIMPRVA
jgi:hypothetical protein